MLPVLPEPRDSSVIATTGTAYVYAPCLSCGQQIRYTCSRDENGTPTLDPETTRLAVELHLRHACEAVPR